MGTGKSLICCAALALTVSRGGGGGGGARAGVIFTDHAAWSAAVAAAGGEMKTLSLTPAAVPMAGGTFTDDELDLFFPENHGNIEIFADGWRGDVHGTFQPGPNVVTLHQPTTALGCFASVGGDVGIDVDAINITIGGGTHKLMRADTTPRPPRSGGGWAICPRTRWSSAAQRRVTSTS